MQQRRRISWADELLVWEFLLSFAALFGAGCFEAFKLFGRIPAAFESSPAVWSSPMMASDDDSAPSQSGRTTTTARQREQSQARAAQQEK
jgi:hypothetical protein